MLELEIQKLTAAIEKLTSVFEAAEAARHQVKNTGFITLSEAVSAVISRGREEAASKAVPTAPAPTAQKTATAKKAEPKPEPEHSPPADAVHVDAVRADAPDAVSSVSKDNLKEIALQITLNDPATKKEILAILASHKSKTITDLPMDQDVLFDVFTRLNNIVHRIAREAEQ